MPIYESKMVNLNKGQKMSFNAGDTFLLITLKIVEQFYLMIKKVQKILKMVKLFQAKRWNIESNNGKYQLD